MRSILRLFVLALSFTAAPVFAQPLQFEGSEFAVNSYTTGSQSKPRVACAPGVGCVVAWDSAGQDGDSSGIFARRYDPSGTAIGNEFQVNTVIAGSQALPDVCMDAAGGFVVAWWGAGPGDSDGAFARRYDAAGAPMGGEFLLNTYTTDSKDGRTSRASATAASSQRGRARKMVTAAGSSDGASMHPVPRWAASSRSTRSL